MTDGIEWQWARIRLSDADWKAYQTVALKRGISMGAMVVTALDTCYGAEMSEVRASFFEEGVQKSVQNNGKEE